MTWGKLELKEMMTRGKASKKARKTSFERHPLTSENENCTLSYAEIKAQVKAELREELKNELKEELKAEIIAEILQNVRNDEGNVVMEPSTGTSKQAGSSCSKSSTPHKNSINEVNVTPRRALVKETAAKSTYSSKKNNDNPVKSNVKMTDSPKVIETRVLRLEKEMKGKTKEDDDLFDYLKRTIDKLRKENKDLFARIDSNNQYNRREILELINVELQRRKNGSEDVEKVVLDFFRDKMGITSISRKDISVTHRTYIPKHVKRGRNEDPSIPPIYVKLLTRKAKNYILRKRHTLRGQVNGKGDRYFVYENLTEFRRGLFIDVKESLKSWRHIYTKEGNILAKKYDDSRPVKINSYEVLNNILSKNLQYFENVCE